MAATGFVFRTDGTSNKKKNMKQSNTGNYHRFIRLCIVVGCIVTAIWNLLQSRSTLKKLSSFLVGDSTVYWSATNDHAPSIDGKLLFADLLRHLMRDPEQVERFYSLANLGNGSDLSDANLSSWVLYKKELEDIYQNAVHVTNQSFCLDWSVNSDLWWTHNPEWEISYELETDTEYCFQYIRDANKTAYVTRLYENQFAGDCTNQLPIGMWSSGWAGDTSNVAHKLYRAVWLKRPVQINKRPWHYAAPDATAKKNKIPSPPACPTMNINCYFLDISNCPALSEDIYDDLDNMTKYPRLPRMLDKTHSRFWWLRQYVTRPQLWLRKRIQEYVKNQTVEIITTPCTALHVRRTDVLWHGDLGRKYHAIAEYMNVTSRKPDFVIHPNILLLTDDHNAIGEAETLFPTYNWMYLNRPRWKGSEGGWEHQIPSSQPIFEMVVLQSTMRLVQQCDNLVWSSSGFAELLVNSIMQGNAAAMTFNLDEGKAKTDVFTRANRQTLNVSNTYAKSVKSVASSNGMFHKQP